MKANKIESLIWIIFASIGALFFIIGMTLTVQMCNYQNKGEAVGVITEVNEYRDTDGNIHGTIWVSYTADGCEYKAKLNAYSSDFYEGREVKIYYDKDNPTVIGMKSLDLLVLIFPGLGLIFLLIGATGIGVKLNAKRRENKLKLYGQRVYAVFVQTNLNTSYSVNGRHPYNIICEWSNPEDGKKYLLKSKNLWFDPQRTIDERNIKTFTVYMNPQNKRKYFVDTDILTDGVVDLT